MSDCRTECPADEPARPRVSIVRTAPPASGYGIRTPLNGWRRPPSTPPDEALIEAIAASVEALGGFHRFVRPGDHVTIKPNFNSGDPPPNSTDIPFLVGLIRLLRDHGAGRVVVGESSRHPPTNARFEMQRTGVFEACHREGAEVVVFGDAHWTPVATRGERFRWVEIARPMIECDRLVFAACLKTHWLTRFSMSLKLIVGAVRPRHRALLHFGGEIEERVAELASTVHPDLVLIDGRSAFVRGGPCYGIVRRPNLILASTDRIAADVEGIRALQRYAECPLRGNPWQYRQIREAIRLGLGVTSADEYDRCEFQVPGSLFHVGGVPLGTKNLESGTRPRQS
jgi:uncharacterized protein (DUF362 family)